MAFRIISLLINHSILNYYNNPVFNKNHITLHQYQIFVEYTNWKLVNLNQLWFRKKLKIKYLRIYDF
jgi:hypothetical protein